MSEGRRHEGNFVDVLRRHAAERGDELAFCFLEDGEREGARLTFGELDLAARALAVRLAASGEPRDRVLLLYPQGLDFVVAYFGCLYAGRVAVPAYPPGESKAERVRAIARDAGAQVALTTTALLPAIAAEDLRLDGGEPLHLWVTDDGDPAPLADSWRRPEVSGETLAFLQYTSGSTGTPKGVMVSHGNLVANSLDLAAEAAGNWPERPAMVNWAPTFHDLGLIFGVLQSVFGGFPCYLLSPQAFIRRPARWLEAISRYRASHSGSPNFGFELCLRKVSAAERERLDLSSWCLALNGAEPIRPETLRRFNATFAACGLRPETFCPAYGLAESTLLITGSPTTRLGVTLDLDRDALEWQGRVEAPATAEATHTLVGVGIGHGHCEVAIVDPQSLHRLEDGRVGEIWAAGPSVTRGYWHRPEITRETFEARIAGDAAGRAWLRTGDLGFTWQGELFITGRIKDLIILRGRNHYPQDLELTAERGHPALRPGCSAAFAVEAPGPYGLEERAALVLEVAAPHVQAAATPAGAEEIFEAVRRAVAEEYEVELQAIALLPPKSVPKTSSGKIQRQACRRAFLDGTLPELARFERRDAAELDEEVFDQAAFAAELEALAPAQRLGRFEEHLRHRAARAFGLEPADLPPDRPWRGLGLDSLRAVSLQLQLERDLGLVWRMSRFLEGPSVAELAREASQLWEARGNQAEAAGEAASAETDALSQNQRSLWFLHRLEPQSSAYHLTFAADLLGETLDPTALGSALRRLVERHAILRTVYRQEGDDEPVQVVLEDPGFDFQVFDAGAWSEKALAERLDAEAVRPFDLASGPVLRARLFVRSPERSTFLLSLHHIATDLWSLEVLLDELSLLYRHFREEAAGRPAPLAGAGPDHGAFVRWQRRRLASPRRQELLTFWRRALQGAPPALELPTDRPHPAVPSRTGGSVAFAVDEALAEALHGLARRCDSTLYTVLLAVFQLLLARLSGQRSVVVGSPAAGRSRAAFENLVGYLVNPLPLRGDFGGDPTFRAALQRSRDTVLAALAHGDFPLPLLVEELQPERVGGRQPLFQVLFVLQRPHRLAALAPFALGEAGHRLDLRGLELESRPLPRRSAQFELTLALAERTPVAGEAGGLLGSLEFETEIFEETTARRLASYYRHLLAAVAAQPDLPVSAYRLMPEALRRQLLGTAVAMPDPVAATIHGAVEAWVRRTPDAVAVVSEKARWTYAELHRKAEALAGRLRRRGVGPEVPVAVCLERSAELVASLLGVLRAGGAYLPVDPSYPEARVTFLLRDAGARLLVTERSLLPRLPTSDLPVLLWNEDEEGEAGDAGISSNTVSSGAGNLAYLIHTSGTTGLPKGVMVEHRSVCSLLAAANHGKTFGAEAFGPGDAWSFFHSQAFDFSVWEIWGALATGGRVVVVPYWVSRSPWDFHRLLRREGVTVLSQTPTAFAELARVDGELVASGEEGLAGLRWVLFGGEALSLESLRPFLTRYGARPALVNLYGITETTVHSTFRRIRPADLDSPGSPIGRALPGWQLRALDEQLEPVPPLVSGEIHVGGAGLARGYLARPSLTAQRFLPDPDATQPGARLYRSGDLARLRDGEFEYLGRRDHQVKLRGHRIELGEITSALDRCLGVRHAAVVVHDGPRGSELVAFFVAEGGSPDTVRQSLLAELPAFMVPGVITPLEKMPRTDTGKIDRRALQALAAATTVAGSPGVGQPLQGAVEEFLAASFADLLGRSTEEIGAQTDFFQLGGHSLLATRLIARLRRDWGVELPVRAVFESPTIEALARRVEGARRGGEQRLPIPPSPEAGPRETGSALSFAQERLWFLDRLHGASAVYNVPLALKLRGPLAVEALHRTLAEVHRRHPVLCTAYPEEGGRPVLRSSRQTRAPLPVVDLSLLSATAAVAALRRLLREETARPFDLATGPLLRALAVRRAPDEHVLLLTVHHIVADGWSLEILRRQFAEIYGDLAAGRPPGAFTPPLPYLDHARRQRQELAAIREPQLAYWRRVLEGLTDRLEMPTDRPRSLRQSFAGRFHRFALQVEAMAGVHRLARERGATPFMVLLAAHAALLARYSGQGDFAVGFPIAGRQRPELEDVVGLFVNTLVLRVRPGRRQRFEELLAAVRATALDAYEHQDLPFELVVEAIAPRRDLWHTPFFQNALAVQDAAPAVFPVGDVEARIVPVEGTVARFELTLFLEVPPEGSPDAAGLAFEASADLYDATTVRRLAGQLRRLLATAVLDPRRSLEDLPLLDAAERHQVITAWNDGGRLLWEAEAEAAEALLHQPFEARAREMPAAPAVVTARATLSYGALERRANQLAWALRRRGVGAESRVGVCLDRRPDLIVAVLAVLKAGGAYLPLDPRHPPRRLADVAGRAGARLVITREAFLDRLKPLLGETGAEPLLLDVADLESQPATPPPCPAGPDNLAYVLFTSGSTGRPKGVMVAHRPAVRLLRTINELFRIGPGERLLFTTAITFDLSVYDVFGLLGAGASLRLASDEELAAPEVLARVLESEGITFWDSAPATLQQLMPFLAPGERTDLRRVFLSGDWIPLGLPGQVRERFPRAEVVSLGGTTETAIWSSTRPVGAVEPHWSSIPYGVPLPGESYLVLDETLRPCPLGVPGDLYIGGAGLARGYVASPATTAARFLPDPFATEPGARLYDTGDRGRWLTAGEVELLGRRDHQVKLRGFRIELGEIQTALAAHPGVGDALVVLREERGPSDLPDQRLVAYLLPVDGAAPESLPDAAVLRRLLADRLPEYMIPAAFVPLASFPQSAHGKIDRSRLPAPVYGQATGEAGTSAPGGSESGRRTPVEDLLVTLLAEVLQRDEEDLALGASFFDLGGHSLLATQLVSRLRGAFGVELPVGAVFEAPTVADLAARVEEALPQKSARAPLPPIEVDEIPLPTRAPLSFAQQRLWLLERLAPGPTYNLAGALALEGPLEPVPLEAAFAAVVERHEALRTRFESGGGEPWQVVDAVGDGAGRVVMPMVDLRALPISVRQEAAEDLARREAARPFDLARGPVLRLALLRLDGESHRLLICLHHIAGDAWSIERLLEEWPLHYRRFQGENVPPPPRLPIQYADFARWQRRWLQGEVLDDLLAAWRQQLAGAPQVLELPADRPRPAVQSTRGGVLRFDLGAELTAHVHRLGRTAGATPFMVLLSAFAVLLHRLTGRPDLLIASPVAGRRQRETEPLIGFFVNTLVLRADLADEPSFAELLGRLRAVALDAYARQDLPFERLVEAVAAERDPSRPPLVQVMLAHQNTPTRAPSNLPEGWTAEVLPSANAVSRFELTLAFEEKAGDGARLRGMAEYSADLFDEVTVRRWLGHLRRLLWLADLGAARPAAELPLLTAAESHQMIEEWSRGRTVPTTAATVLELIDRQAGLAPSAVAMEDPEDDLLTYAELIERSTRLARHLRHLGVGRGEAVGVLLEEGMDLVVAFLAVLRAGGVYVPLDPALPRRRIEELTKAAGLRHLLTELPPRKAGAAAAWPAPEAEDLAYALFTSGSTGEPKGVMIPHGGLAGRIADGVEQFGLARGDRLLLFFRSSFDASVWQILLALAAGATLCLASAEQRLPGRPLLETLRRRRITHGFFTPSALAQLPDEAPRRLPAVRCVVVGGEACPEALPRRWADRRFVNAYGPTEATILVTVAEDLAEAAAAGSPPIGWPVAGVRAHVLDRQGRLQLPGVSGELFVGGTGLARGYLGRPAATAAAFVPDPFADEPGRRLYRTGDRVRQRGDGQLEFLGRLDAQVKVRGFRIELGEVEAVLRSHPQVRAAAVVLAGDGARARLAAFTEAADGPVPAAEVRAFLEKHLPSYMVPTSLREIEALPVTANGKLDRRALVALAADEPRSDFVSVDGMRGRIAEVWREVLGVAQVGGEDSFFDLGGNSLLLAQVQDRLEEHFQRTIPLMDLFRHPTVAELARYLGGEEAPSASPRPLRPPGALAGADAVAIVGMACRFPGAEDPETFWRNLAAGVESITFFSQDELRAAGVEEELLSHPDYVPARGALGAVDGFDADFFGLTPREAETLDPQHRLLLEVAWEALERAGYGAGSSSLRPRSEDDGPPRTPAVGVFAGSGTETYLLRNLHPNRELREGVGLLKLSLGNDPDFLTTAIAYRLGLTGPAVTVRTACSTSLVAVHMACRSLLDGECDLALAGGVSVHVPHRVGYLWEEGMIFSRDGHCRAFDAAASGTVVGDGAGLVVLKRLADALADGDPVHAVVRGSAINNDGPAKMGFTAPSIAGQTAVITAALERAGVPAESVGYVEAHGTGTPLGDPVELEALTEVFGRGTARRAFCALGSVKTNVGHLNTAAGVAGLMKAALALEHEQLPPSLHFERPNPEVDLAKSPFFVADRLQPWPEASRSLSPRRAGVSSFGIGGTNAHAVLEEAPGIEAASDPGGREAQLLVVSARSEAALARTCEALAARLERGDLSLADAAYTLATGRRAFPLRRAVVAREPAAAAQALRAPAAPVPAEGSRGVVFLLPGQGAQHPWMAAGLYRDEPVFRQALDRCSDLFVPYLGRSLAEALYGPRPVAEEGLAATDLAQPAIFAVEFAVAELWRSWGVTPAALLGHSLGEITAACLAGVFTLEDAAALVAARGRLMAATQPGAMLEALAGPEELAPFVAEPDLDLAAFNGPKRSVISGSPAAVEDLGRRLAAAGFEYRTLATSRAFHSRLMEPVLEELEAILRSLPLAPPRLPFLSGITGRWITDAEATDPAYWSRQARQPVRFADGLATLVQRKELEPAVLLEVGPGQTLAGLVRRQAAQRTTVASLPHRRGAGGGERDLEHCLGTAGALWSAGVELDWHGFYAGQRRRRVILPTYPFERRRYWIEPPGTPAPASAPAAAEEPVKRPDPADWFYVPSWRRAPLSPTLQAAGEAPRTVLLAGEDDWSTALAESLRQKLPGAVVVRPGQDFERFADGGFRINPVRPEDFAALLAQLPASCRSFIHLWGLAAAPLDETAPTGPATYDCLLHLARALGRREDSGPACLLGVTVGAFEAVGGERLRPQAALALGPLTVLPQEYPDLRCRALDLDAPELSGGDPGRLAAALARELRDLEAQDVGQTAVVALRHAHRWVRQVEPLAVAAPAGEDLPLRRRGVYLITGGFGGIGGSLARHLAAAYQARLVLLSRGGAGDATGDEGRRRFVEELEALGAEVFAPAVDVTAEAEIAAALDAALECFGSLDGVVHAAGVPGGAVAELRTPAKGTAVLAPRVTGTLHLARLLEARLAERRQRLDFFCLCSSLTAMLGGFGQLDYCAANAFLDAFAQSRQVAGGPVISVAWNAWREVGMAQAADDGGSQLWRQRRAESLALGLTPAEGVEVFRRALAAGQSQLLISTDDLRRRLERDDRSVESVARQEAGAPPPSAGGNGHHPAASGNGNGSGHGNGSGNGARHPRPALPVPFTAPRTALEEAIAVTWQDLLGLEPVGVRDDFFQLGGDSLLATQVVSRLRQRFEIALSIGRLFEDPTVAGLAERIEAARLRARLQAPAQESPGGEEEGEL